MIRLLSIVLFGLLFLNVPQLPVCAETAQNENVNAVNSFDESEEEFDFTNTSYLTDEQLQEAKQIDQIDEKTSFTSKIINSGHFTSGTASKTYIPINKVLD